MGHDLREARTRHRAWRLRPDESDALPRDYESIQAMTLGQEAFPTAFTPSMLVVFYRGDNAPLTAADTQKTGEVLAGLTAKRLPDVELISPPTPAPNNVV